MNREKDREGQRLTFPSRQLKSGTTLELPFPLWAWGTRMNLGAGWFNIFCSVQCDLTLIPCPLSLTFFSYYSMFYGSFLVIFTFVSFSFIITVAIFLCRVDFITSTISVHVQHVSIMSICRFSLPSSDTPPPQVSFPLSCLLFEFSPNLLSPLSAICWDMDWWGAGSVHPRLPWEFHSHVTSRRSHFTALYIFRPLCSFCLLLQNTGLVSLGQYRSSL